MELSGGLRLSLHACLLEKFCQSPADSGGCYWPTQPGMKCAPKLDGEVSSTLRKRTEEWRLSIKNSVEEKGGQCSPQTDRPTDRQTERQPRPPLFSFYFSIFHFLIDERSALSSSTPPPWIVIILKKRGGWIVILRGSKFFKNIPIQTVPTWFICPLGVFFVI